MYRRHSKKLNYNIFFTVLMYSALDLNELIKEASEYILTNDRMLFKEILVILEEYTHKKKYLIHSRDILLGREITKDNFNYSVIITGGYDTAKELADELINAKSPHLNLNTLSLMTSIKNLKFNISVEMRNIITIINADKIEPITYKTRGLFTDEVYCSDSLLHLIDVYGKMYNFNNYKTWESEMRDEALLFDLFATNNTSYKQKANNYAAKIIGLFSCIVVGDVAMSLRNGEYNGRLQVISSLDIENIITLIHQGLNKSVKYNTSYFVFDVRLKKYTVKLIDYEFDVYNSADYELLPYNVINDVKCGNDFVLLKYALIQYYIIKVILGFNATLELYLTLRANMLVKYTENPVELFNKDNLYGVNIAENIVIKKIIAEQDRFNVYYPAIVAKIGGDDESAKLGVGAVWYSKAHLRIAQKITGDLRKDIPAILADYYKTKTAMWAGNGAINSKKYAKFARFIPRAQTYLDIGSGDASEFEAIRVAIGANRAISADIADYRKTAKSAEFYSIVPNKNIALPSESIGVVSFIHSLHHAVDALFRLRDIARLLRVGGIILIKDHDVSSDKSADNVSFEHFVYSVGEGTASIEDAEDYQEIEPMYFYSAEFIRKFIIGLGFEEKYFVAYENDTSVYVAIFQKKTKISGGCLYKGFD
jgi:SAM-dependent methyltransferase